ncbi:MAG: sll0787 family AIR synthase-like protein [Leptolyngbyaceae cyanobacterium MO_188.B28]|nr:sll0787 family AIR synthase-like protein [Leptolyngbyaceae cyanobacterium MO_188.B28]
MLPDLIASLHASKGILGKQDIQTAARAIGQYAQGMDAEPIRLGDDCAAIPDGDGYLLLAAEGLWPQLVTQDPWFAGWCAVMVNLSDIAAMGGAPIAVVDALWSQSVEESQLLWEGMKAAAQAYGVPIVGGHTNCGSPYNCLAVAILGRAQQLITSFGAQPGDDLVMVVNLEGRYYGDYPFWNAATETNSEQLRLHLAQLPELARSELCNAGKDISMGGLAGTVLMLAEASGCGAILYIDQIPRPADVPWSKWLTSFPSFGFLLSVPPENLAKVEALFRPHGLTCQAIGKMTTGSQVLFQRLSEQCLFWDLANPLTGFGNHSQT